MLIDLASRQRADALERRVVIIVEDDPRLLQAMSDSVAGMNLDVFPAKHYDAAIRHLEGRRTHLVCVDIGLPDRSGYELCEYMRSRSVFGRVPILATGEYGTSHDLAQAEYAGANGFLLKPFAIRKFTLCIQSMLDGRRGRTSPMRDLALAHRFPADFAASAPREAAMPVSAA
jgi:two-component system chemotaxis response regulator CheY